MPRKPSIDTVRIRAGMEVLKVGDSHFLGNISHGQAASVRRMANELGIRVTIRYWESDPIYFTPGLRAYRTK